MTPEQISMMQQCFRVHLGKVPEVAFHDFCGIRPLDAVREGYAEWRQGPGRWDQQLVPTAKLLGHTPKE